MAVVGSIDCWIQSGCASLGLTCKVWCDQILEQSITAQCSLTLAWGCCVQSLTQPMTTQCSSGRQVQCAESIGLSQRIVQPLNQWLSECSFLSHTGLEVQSSIKCDVRLSNTWSNQSRLSSRATQSNGRVHWQYVLLQVRCVQKPRTLPMDCINH